MEKGMPDINELNQRAAARRSAPVQSFATAKVRESMIPRGVVARQCYTSDTSLRPLPILLGLDTTVSMGHVPSDLATGDLARLLVRLTETGACGALDPQINFCGISDFSGGSDAFRFGQFERDNRMDTWLTGLCESGDGGGSDPMHEAYNLCMYAANAKVDAHIWKTGGKGYLFMAGDEMCPDVLPGCQIQRIFGDHSGDLDTRRLLTELTAKWHVFFLYIATGFYERGGETGSTEKIWQHWQQRLGQNAIRLDAKGTALPEIISSLIGMTEGHFTATQVPQKLLELGCSAEIIAATARALNVQTGSTATQAHAEPRKRGPRRV